MDDIFTQDMKDTIKMIEELKDHVNWLVQLVCSDGEMMYQTHDVAFSAIELKAALTVLQKIASGDDWFPIESAPRDGTPILFTKEGGIEIGWMDWCPHTRKYYPSNDDSDVLTPTHWKPLDGAEHIKMLMEKELNK